MQSGLPQGRGGNRRCWLSGQSVARILPERSALGLLWAAQGAALFTLSYSVIRHIRNIGRVREGGLEAPTEPLPQREDNFYWVAFARYAWPKVAQ